MLIRYSTCYPCMFWEIVCDNNNDLSKVKNIDIGGFLKFYSILATLRATQSFMVVFIFFTFVFFITNKCLCLEFNDITDPFILLELLPKQDHINNQNYYIYTKIFCLGIQSHSNIIIHKSLNCGGSKHSVETFVDEKTLFQLVT